MAPGGILGALFNGLFMALMAGYLLWMGAMWLFCRRRLKVEQ